APEYSRREHQRLRQDIRVFERQVVEDGVALTPELLDDMHLVGMKVTATPDPCRVDEADGVEHERIALPVSHRVAEVLVRVPGVRAVLAVVSRDHPKFRESSTGIAELSVEKRNV